MAVVGIAAGFGTLYTLANDTACTSIRAGGEIRCFERVNKTVSVKITNELHSNLLNPELNILSGKVYSLLPEIKKGEVAQLLFHKTPMSMRGAVGAFTYTIKNENIKAAIYYENPYIGNNWFGLRWYGLMDRFDESVVDDWERRETDMWKVENPIKHHQIQYGTTVVKGFMSQGEHAQLEVIFKNCNK